MGMNRTQKILLGCFITLCIAALWVIKEAPLFVKKDVGGIKIGQGWDDYFYIRGDELDCAADPISQRTICKTMLNGSILRAAFTTPEHGIRAGDFCEVEYDGVTTPCRADYAIFNTFRFGIYVDNNLGISPERMAGLRSQHPLLYYPEDFWLHAATAAVVVVTILLILFNWNSPKRKQSSRKILRFVKWTGASAALLVVLWYGALWGLIILGYVD